MSHEDPKCHRGTEPVTVHHLIGHPPLPDATRRSEAGLFAKVTWLLWLGSFLQQRMPSAVSRCRGQSRTNQPTPRNGEAQEPGQHDSVEQVQIHTEMLNRGKLTATAHMIRRVDGIHNNTGAKNSKARTLHVASRSMPIDSVISDGMGYFTRVVEPEHVVQGRPVQPLIAIRFLDRACRHKSSRSAAGRVAMATPETATRSLSRWDRRQLCRGRHKDQVERE